MSDVTLENNELNMNDLMDEIEKSLRLPRGGEIVTGKVHQVTDKEVIVDLEMRKGWNSPYLRGELGRRADFIRRF